MGTFTSVSGPDHVVRVSPTAWALALSTAGKLSIPEGPTPPGLAALQPDALGAAWGELGSAGIAEGSSLSPVWQDALHLVLNPVTLLKFEARYNDVGGNSDVSIDGARGVCVHTRRTVESTNDGGFRTVAHEPAVEISLFDVASVWGAIARTLPPLQQVRADAVHARSVLAENVVRIDADAGTAVQPEEASVSAAMTTRAGAGRQVWAARWSVSGAKLHSVGLRDGTLTLTSRPAGHIAREVIFALAGAYEFAASSVTTA